MSEREDFLRTIGYGESALGQLKRNEVPAFPRNYELWYTYAAGFNRALNRAVNEILRLRGRITPDEVAHVYNVYLSPSRLGDRVEEVGGKVANEISELAKLIDQTLGSATSYGASLEEASNDLRFSTDQAQVQAVIKRLIAATIDVEATNRRLKAQLGESKVELTELQASLEAIRYESLTDQLTTLANRKHFDQSIERAIADADPGMAPLSLIFADIDFFKRFNDTYGHQTGDQVLRLVALALKQTVKGKDIACRYGGEEFAVILPRTSLDQAKIVGEQIREAVMAKELVKRSTGQNLGRVTLSIGISCYRLGDTVQTLIERADFCLYAAKNAGRNMVATEDSLTADESRRSVA